MISVLFFAQLADLAQCDSVDVGFSDGLTPRKLLDILEPNLPAELITYLVHDVCVVSINKAMAEWDQPLSDNDEVAFLPPFSGG